MTSVRHLHIRLSDLCPTWFWGKLPHIQKTNRLCNRFVYDQQTKLCLPICSAFYIFSKSAENRQEFQSFRIMSWLFLSQQRLSRHSRMTVSEQHNRNYIESSIHRKAESCIVLTVCVVRFLISDCISAFRAATFAGSITGSSANRPYNLCFLGWWYRFLLPSGHS